MSTSEADPKTIHLEVGDGMATDDTHEWQEIPDSDDVDEEVAAAGEEDVEETHEEVEPTESSTELVVQTRREPRKFTRFGGNTDRKPETGVRGKLYEMGVNVGPSVAEIISVTRDSCIGLRETLRGVAGALCLGCFSGKGGPGKSTLSTLLSLLLHDINPVRDDVILIDMNTSQTTLHELNGLAMEDFLSGKYWTLQTLWAYLDQHPCLDKLEFDEINRKLAYRSNPQLPIIPNIVEASDFAEDEVKFTGEKYLLVLMILKRFFTIIVHDFGTETKVELTRVALKQQHMLCLLTHSGKATTKMVAHNLEMLHLNLVGLLMNTVVVFSVSQQPSRAASRAIELERAGKVNKSERILGKLPGGKKATEIRTPGEALEVINGIVERRKLIYPLTQEDIVLIGFDPHLKMESTIFLEEVTPAVKAQLWTVLQRLLEARVEYESLFLQALPEGATIWREQMAAQLDSTEPDPQKREAILSIAESQKIGAVPAMALPQS
jgi:MinD-like ATPase involved in chromosome partitioning or flagellar assembly